MGHSLGHQSLKSLPPLECKTLSLSIKPPKLDLKVLPEMLKYAFLGDGETFSVVISSNLENHQEVELLTLLRRHTKAIGWTIADIQGIISPSISLHSPHLSRRGKTKSKH